MRTWWRVRLAALASLRAVYGLGRELSRGEKSGPQVVAELDAMEAEERAVTEARRVLGSAKSEGDPDVR